jgi:hypothetical protein
MKTILDKIRCIVIGHITVKASCPYTGLTYIVCYKCGKTLNAK